MPGRAEAIGPAGPKKRASLSRNMAAAREDSSGPSMTLATFMHWEAMWEDLAGPSLVCIDESIVPYWPRIDKHDQSLVHKPLPRGAEIRTSGPWDNHFSGDLPMVIMWDGLNIPLLTTVGERL